ncbi:glycerate kinase [Bacillus sp. CECT 9360]|uniref:glycerate kinase n=1 Tax=Bacillus sp. CECT 9360 TaxID=2845821 RepID=UPI001E37912D|nr:glycerate kinase [Bacillus sp. CECT 9360]CAH0343954.1 Glycerate 2-kinase [Bacillus sp. CECT 9360]
MKIVIAPDSFKESLTSMEVCHAVENGFRKIFPSSDYVKIPIGDGGEGTVQSLVDGTDGRLVSLSVTGPLGNKVDGFYGISGDGQTAFIEMAAASGLHLVPKEQRNPLLTTTRGTGELIFDALNRDVKQIILGLGGSATNDGGVGMAAALGVKFFNKADEEIPPQADHLNDLYRIDISKLDVRLKDIKVEAACDVTNPLVGEKGASAVFGPQKGATEKMIKMLDKNLHNYAEVVENCLHVSIKDLPGAGAAGGLGAGVLAFLNGELKKGIDIVLDFTNFEQLVNDADLVITGEGQIDSQTIYGKAPIGVAKRAKKYDIPVIAIAGSIGSNYEAVYDHGIDAVFSIVNEITTLEAALENGKLNMEKTAENVARLLRIK